MASDLIIPGGDSKLALPAHIQARFGGEASNILSGDRLPTLSIKGKVFTVTADGESWPMMKADADTGMETPLGSLPVVVLDYGVKLGRSYYEGEYDPNETKGPKCWSADSVTPDDAVEEKQSDRCASCPFASKGSKVTPQGKSVSACAQNRLLAVVPVRAMTTVPPLRLRIAPTSNYDGRSPELKAKQFFAFQNYLDFLKGRGLHNTRAVVTTISFDPAAAYPKLVFKAQRFVSPLEIEQIDALMDAGGVEAILGRYGTMAKEGAIAAAPAARTIAAPKEHPAEVALAKAGAANPALNKATGGFVAPEMEDGEDEDDYADRVTAARRDHKAQAANAARGRAQLEAATSKPATAFVAPEQEDGEDEDDYADRVTAARRAHKAAQAAPAAAKAPPPFVAPEMEDGEDEDDYQDRVTAARRAHKAKHGAAPAAPAAAAPAAPAAPAAAPAAAEPAKRTRRSKAEMEAARAAAAPAAAVAEEVPAGQEKAPEKFIPGALSGADLGDDDEDGPGLAAAPAPAPAAKATGAKATGAKAGAAAGPKAGKEVPAAAVPGDVSKLLETWDD